MDMLPLSVTAEQIRSLKGSSGLSYQEARGRNHQYAGRYDWFPSEEFQKTGKPIVLIDRMIQGLSCDCVLVDNENAAEKAVGMLVEEQHQKIGLIGGPDEVFTARQRMLGYMKALGTHGIAVDEKLICHGDYTIQGGVQAVEELVKRIRI